MSARTFGNNKSDYVWIRMMAYSKKGTFQIEHVPKRAHSKKSTFQKHHIPKVIFYFKSDILLCFYPATVLGWLTNSVTPIYNAESKVSNKIHQS